MFARLWEAAALEPSIIGRYEEYVDTSGHRGGGAVRKSEAYEQWREAIVKVGPIAADEVIAVCCTDEPVKGAARIEIMRRGLDVLAHHFGV